jgi:hypothetical protein
MIENETIRLKPYHHHHPSSFFLVCDFPGIHNKVYKLEELGSCNMCIVARVQLAGNESSRYKLIGKYHGFSKYLVYIYTEKEKNVAWT